LNAVGVVMVLGGHDFLRRVGRVWTRQLPRIGGNEASWATMKWVSHDICGIAFGALRRLREKQPGRDSEDGWGIAFRSRLEPRYFVQ